jgi:hypothetical protein
MEPPEYGVVLLSFMRRPFMAQQAARLKALAVIKPGGQREFELFGSQHQPNNVMLISICPESRAACMVQACCGIPRHDVSSNTSDSESINRSCTNDY